MENLEPNYVIFVPRILVTGQMDNDLREGVLMAYCLMHRYESADGIYRDTLRSIMLTYGSHYDENKTKNLPASIIKIIKGFDFLYDHAFFKINRGDYHSLDSCFELQLKRMNIKIEKFVIVNYKDFDRLLRIEKRTDKTSLLYLLLFISSCYSKLNIDGQVRIYTVCSYSKQKISEMTGIKLTALTRYISQLCVDENESKKNDKILVKSRMWTIKIGERPIHFPNIYVLNNSDALPIIRAQRKLIDMHFKNKVEHYTSKVGVMELINLAKEKKDELDLDDLF